MRRMRVATALIAGGVISTTGIAAFAIRKFGNKKTVDIRPDSTPTKKDCHGY